MCSLPNDWGRNSGRPTTEDGGQHLSAIFVSAAKFYGETPFASSILHPSTLCLFIYFPPPPLLGFSSSSPHLPGKQTQVIRGAAALFFVFFSTVASEFAFFLEEDKEFLFHFAHPSFLFDVNTCFDSLLVVYHLRLLVFYTL